MKGFFNHVLASMLGTFLVVVLLGVVQVVFFLAILSSSGAFSDEKAKVSENSILKIEFKNAVRDKMSIKPNSSTFKFDKVLSLKSVTDAIKRAKEDKRIKGIYLDISFLDMGIASAEEIRNALSDFKKSGKFIVAHSDLYTHKSYYLASVADEIYLTPAGGIQFTGLSAQLVYFKSLLDNLGLEPEIIRHGKFKSAVEPFMSDKISEANKEQTQKYLNSIWGTITEGVSEERKIPSDKLNFFADNLIITSADSAKKHNFVDGLKYKDEVVAELKEKIPVSKDDKLKTVSLPEYINEKNGLEELVSEKENNIAIIYASGEIVDGTGTEEQIGSKTLSEAIRKAREDKSVKAVVLRINSPGGSSLASEVIWRETVLTRNEKPLIVSMGDVAASGGYYIACAADTIVAEPNTVTGSIGVFGLLFNAKPLFDNIGVTVNTVNTNKYSDIGNPGRRMSEYERAVIQKSVENIYEEFVSRVSEGRSLPSDSVDAIGQGRVWSGADAKNIGLVDVLGGLETAIEIASQKAGIKDFGIKTYPEKDKFSMFIESAFTQTKTSLVKEEFGDAYKYYKNFKNLKNVKGIQARLPYYIEIK